MPRYRLIGFVLVILVTSPAVAQTLATGQPVLVDANGQAVGPVARHFQGNARDTFWTVLFVDDRPVYLWLPDTDRNILTYDFNDGLLIGVLFESIDCTGQAYLVGSGVEPGSDFLSLPAFADNSPELSLWVHATTTVVTGLSFQSSLDFFGGCDDTETSFTSGIAAVEVPTSFVGPYRVERAAAPFVSPSAVPAVSPAGLAVLSMLLLVAAWWWLRR